MECKFIEYQNYDDYINDMEIQNMIKGESIENNKKIYWKLEKYNIQNVKRDINWFNDNLSKIEKFWINFPY
jgi:hypothetical protein